MGLDVTAYRGLEIIPDAVVDDDGEAPEGMWSPGAAMEWSEGQWPGRAAGIPDAKACYRYADRDGSIGYSYGSHRWFRDHLARITGLTGAQVIWDDPKPGPFMELIEFADNEGVIGPIVAAKLAADFAEFQSAAERHDGGPNWLRCYNQWRAACEIAADNGALDFH